MGKGKNNKKQQKERKEENPEIIHTDDLNPAPKKKSKKQLKKERKIREKYEDIALQKRQVEQEIKDQEDSEGFAHKHLTVDEFLSTESLAKNLEKTFKGLLMNNKKITKSESSEGNRYLHSSLKSSLTWFNKKYNPKDKLVVKDFCTQHRLSNRFKNQLTWILKNDNVKTTVLEFYNSEGSKNKTTTKLFYNIKDLEACAKKAAKRDDLGEEITLEQFFWIYPLMRYKWQFADYLEIPVEDIFGKKYKLEKLKALRKEFSGVLYQFVPKDKTEITKIVTIVTKEDEIVQKHIEFSADKDLCTFLSTKEVLGTLENTITDVVINKIRLGRALAKAAKIKKKVSGYARYGIVKFID